MEGRSRHLPQLLCLLIFFVAYVQALQPSGRPPRRVKSLESSTTFATQPIKQRSTSQQQPQRKIPRIDESTKTKLLTKLLESAWKESSLSTSSSSIPQFTTSQIEDFIITYKPSLSLPDETTGILPLRTAIRSGRRDLVRLLLRHGAYPGDVDEEGLVIKEILSSTKPGSLTLLTDILERCDDQILQKLLCDEDIRVSRHSMKYWIKRGVGKAPSFFPDKLSRLGLPRLSALKYRVIGQDFALESVFSEIASYYVNSELSSKPLVLLFSGPPGHGKTETVKQLADLLDAPYWKVDCRNHAHPWEMFGSAAGFVGSELGSPLGNFIYENSGKRSVVLLDEFDHCDTETWEGFYHIFDEGEFTYKKVGRNGQYSAPGGGDRNGVDNYGATGNNVQSASTSRSIDCSKTIFFLTTNRFDDDIEVFNSRFKKEIDAFRKYGTSYDNLRVSFDAYIRPKLREFFKGGLTRRIDSVVPFFKFDEEEAYVVADMYIDFVRRQYMLPPSRGRLLGDLYFDVTASAVAQLSKVYTLHSSDGASAIKREVYASIVKKLHTRWLRAEENNKISDYSGDAVDNPLWFHIDEDILNTAPRNELCSVVIMGEVSREQQDRLPYFVDVSEEDSFFSDLVNQLKQNTTAEGLLSILQKEDSHEYEEHVMSDQMGYYQSIYDSMEEYVRENEEPPMTKTMIQHAAESKVAENESSSSSGNSVGRGGGPNLSNGIHNSLHDNLEEIQNIYDGADAVTSTNIGEISGNFSEKLNDIDEAMSSNLSEKLSEYIDINLFFDGMEETPVSFSQFATRNDTMSNVLGALCNELHLVDEARLWYRVYKSENSEDSNLEDIILSTLSNPTIMNDNKEKALEKTMQLGSSRPQFGAGWKLCSTRAITGDLADVDENGWQLIREPARLNVHQVSVLQNSYSAHNHDEDLIQPRTSKDEVIWKFHPNFFVSFSNESNSNEESIDSLSTSIDLLIETKQGTNTDFERWHRDSIIQSWRELLKDGDLIDMESKLLKEKLDISRYPSWIEGYVESIGNEIQIRAVGTDVDKSVYLNRRSPSIQPLYSKSDNWRRNLKIGSGVDVRISKSMWVVGKIVNISGEDKIRGKEVLHISVGSDDSTAIKMVKRYSEEIAEISRNSGRN